MKARIISILLLCVLLLCACSKDLTSVSETSVGESEDVTGTDTSNEETPDYPYDIADCEGSDFSFLNCVDELWYGTYHILTYEEECGEMLSDAVYARNQKLEEDMNVNLAVIKAPYTELNSYLSKAVLSSDPVYDAAYIPLAWSGATPLDGVSGVNLYSISTLNLREKWWNQNFIKSATLFNKNLTATIDNINLMGYSFRNVLFFNKDMMVDYGLALPYDLIRSGEWTYDKMYEYISAVTNLKGDDSFEVAENGICIYGLSVQHAEGIMTLWMGSGESFIKFDDSGIPTLTDDYTRLYDAYSKLLSMFSVDGNCVMYDTADFTAYMIFCQGRSLFQQSQLGYSSTYFRSVDIEYGIIPPPKYDEQQSDYYTPVSPYTLSLVIPKSASDYEKCGSVLDYLAYLSYYDVIPALMDTFCYKGTRDDDSIEMLDIIMDSATIDIGYIFGWTQSLIESLSTKTLSKNDTFVSSFEAQKSSIETKIAKTLNAVNNAS